MVKDWSSTLPYQSAGQESQPWSRWHMALASSGRESQIRMSGKAIITPVNRFSTAGGRWIISTGSLKPEAGLCSPYYSQEEDSKLHLCQEAPSGWKTYGLR